MKSYVKLAQTLIVLGMGIFAFERFGLAELSGGRNGAGGMHLDPNLLSVLVLAPILLIVAGCLVWMVGRMRGAK